MMRVGIAGTGSIAFGTACLLQQRGHQVTLWSPSGKADVLKDAPLQAEGVLEGPHPVSLAADARALAQEDVLMIAVPGYGMQHVLTALVPHIRDGQSIIISSHCSFAALFLSSALSQRCVRAQIIAWGTTIVTGRKRGPSQVHVNTIREQVDLSAVPETDGSDALALCTELFGERFRRRDGLMAIQLSNLNPQNHMGIAMCNMTRMERGETWSQGQNITPNVGRLLEALDLERLAIAAAFDVEVRTIFDHFHLSFHVPRGTISDMNQQMHAQGNGGNGPPTADSRYVTEDVPFGLYVTEELGRIANVPTPLHSAGVDLFSAMYGRDFRLENNILASLDLKSLSQNQLQEICRAGFDQ